MGRPSASSGAAIDDGGYHIRPHDILIAVMGVTGAGKSTFISHFTKVDIGIGHGLEGYTSIVQVYKCPYDKDRDLYMIDTPGFNDTYKSDTDILREIASWLGRAYEKKVLLSGIIYLHRVSDTRFSGKALKNLNMFKVLCGPDCLPNVVLATTFWSPDDLARQEAREEELCEKPQYWSAMIKRGSTVFRQDKGPTSAFAIVRYLLSKARHGMVLDIQREMVDEGRVLEDTEAGKKVSVETEEERQKFHKRLARLDAEYQAARAKRDVEAQRELDAYRQETEQKLDAVEENRRKMRADFATLQVQMDEELAEQNRQIEIQMQRNQSAIEERERQLDMADQQHRSELQNQNAEHELAMLRSDQARLAWKKRPWYQKMFDYL